MQLSIGLPAQIPKDAYYYGRRSNGEIHGVVLTKPHVVELILDLAGYTTDVDLPALRLLEPACGHGAFLAPAVARLVAVARRRRMSFEKLRNAILAFDIDPTPVTRSREAVAGVLREGGVSAAIAEDLVRTWIVEGDFLLAGVEGGFGAVVGNPPYVRTEQIAPVLQSEYRARYQSLFDRADLYVAFIERGLRLLGPRGILSFVCADRWTLNRYGAPLRKMVSDEFVVRCYVDLHQASPFESEVIAYPAIFAIGREHVEQVGVAHVRSASPSDLTSIGRELVLGTGSAVERHEEWFKGAEPWTLSSPEHLSALRELEEKFAPIEDHSRARVGIGVATGNDGVYIVGEDADIEADRLVPLVMRDDIDKGTIRDARRFVINTFEESGGAIDLARYPRLARYLNLHGAAVRKRHVAKTRPETWFRTIDRVYPELVTTPKLLIPDIAGSNEVAFDCGRFHPHHNLYFVVSSAWDIEVLGGLLASRVALFFVWSYAVKMRGGYLRFQAQYLRRIRLPIPDALTEDLRRGIRVAFRKRDFARLDELALRAYERDSLPAFDFVDTRGR
jgi:hypothetical protein